ncbi:translesion error-prone DNA polymerase V subunit UmuC [Marinobacterium sp. A346]|uniref:Translesion error-prone DNA polymerase V subunit UmuC n=2 Tax=Marinobacterium weihaiense TaxID=2851016 RepID=A0ABS6MFP5_9GAMM|nr:translesion error-prone DNA polymerase V subunit UmuC [Marinobacterium weihaiense]
MGAPAFRYAELFLRHQVTVFSSNYALYADMSARVMQILEQQAPAVEVYSIDEAFLDLSGTDALLTLPDWACALQQQIRQWTGIGVGIGLAPSKTLAKLANLAAKRWPATGGVVDLRDPARQQRLMTLMPIEDVWGVGRRLARRLRAEGIDTALALAKQDPRSIRQRYSVVLERTLRELRGEACQSLEAVSARQQIISSRSFGQRVESQASLQQAISHHISRAAEKLRADQRLARQLSISIRTGLFNPQEPSYSRHASACLPEPSDDSIELLRLGRRLLQQIWQPGYRYAKASVMLNDLYDRSSVQPDLFQTGTRMHPALMPLLDQINHSGRGRIFFASQGIDPDWQMKRAHLSPAYTTRWSDLPRVR